MRSAFILFVLACFITACNSGKKFTSRKYTSGRYVSHVAHKQKVKTTHTENQNTVVVAQKSGSIEAAEVKAPVQQRDEVTTAARPKESKTQTDNKARIFLENRVAALEKNKLVQTFSKTAFLTKRKSVEKQKATEDGSSNTSLVATILSSLGVIMDVAGFILALATVEYIFLALCGVGLALGIVGLVMGIRGIREYKREKANGNNNVATLVLGIIGTAVGGVAIFLAAYLGLLGLFIISFA